MKRFVALLLVIASAGLAACNTVAGAGRDMSAGGHDLTNKAEQSK
jgi:predicted small secreted protein